MSKKKESSAHRHNPSGLTKDSTFDEATAHLTKGDIETGARKSRRVAPRAAAPSTQGFPLVIPQNGIRRAYAEYHAGYYAADRIVYIYRPTIHERHVWEVDVSGHITAQLERTAPGRVVDGALTDRQDGRDGLTEGGASTLLLASGDKVTSMPAPVGTEPQAPLLEVETLAGVPEETAAMETIQPINSGEPGETQAALVLLDERRRPLTIPVQLTHDGQDAQEKRDIMVSSAVEIAHEVEGEVAARLIAILYRIASDPPYWRQPLITVETNLLLDQLGYKRSKEGYHENRNREVVRDTLIGLQRVEIRAQRFDPTSPTGRALYRAPLIYLRGGQYSIEETKDIPMSTLLERGLPTSLTIELGWYAGVRQADGRLGNNYALQPRASTFFGQLTAQQGTADALLEFLYLMRSLHANTSQPLVLTRGAALRRAHIHTRNVTRARQILEAALNRLKERGYVSNYTPIPSRPHETFEVTLCHTPPIAGTEGAEGQERSGRTTATRETRGQVPQGGEGSVLHRDETQPQALSSKAATLRAGESPDGQRTNVRSRPGSPARQKTSPSLWDHTTDLASGISQEAGQDDRESTPPSPAGRLIQHPAEGASADESTSGSINPFIDAATGQTGWYTETLAIRGVVRRATDVWRLVCQRLEQQKPTPPMLTTLLYSTQARWCATQLAPGDVQPWFVLRLPSGLAHLGETILVPPVQAALDQYWPGMIGVRIEHRLPGEE